MKSVILLGHAMYDTTKAEVSKLLRHNPEIELWVLNGFWVAYGSNYYKPTRIFQVHSAESLNSFVEKKNKNGFYPLQQMYNRTGARVIVCDTHYGIENQELYPVGYMSKYGKNFYTSTFSYMIAMAIEECFEEIHMLGFQFMSTVDDDYTKQLPQARYGIIKAREQGIKVITEFENEWDRLMPETDIKELIEIENPYIEVLEYQKAAGMQ